jgi:hypothetical protein
MLCNDLQHFQEVTAFHIPVPDFINMSRIKSKRKIKCDSELSAMYVSQKPVNYKKYHDGS